MSGAFIKAVSATVLRRSRGVIALYLLLNVINAAVFFLYRIPPEPFYYSAVLGLFFLLILLIVRFVREYHRKQDRERIFSSLLTQWQCLPSPLTGAEADYQRMIEELGRHIDRLQSDFADERQDMQDYYTAWVHQIKTPIAVMRMKLGEDTAENRALSVELFRIEQYVDMVLSYIRLGSSTNDLVIREYSLDELLRESVRKYATLFIEKRLKLNFVPTNRTIVTDRKWFAVIVEQLLSNAIKYTPAGTVSLSYKEGFGLQIADTGIGIAPEDLPRIFEKGYTGRNGRLGEKSSGLGLYLAHRAAALINVSLTAESTVGAGTVFTLQL